MIKDTILRIVAAIIALMVAFGALLPTIQSVATAFSQINREVTHTTAGGIEITTESAVTLE